MSESKQQPQQQPGETPSNQGEGSFSAPPSNANKPIMPPHSAGYSSIGSVPSPSFHLNHQQQQQQQQQQGVGGQYVGGDIPPHSAPPYYQLKHDGMGNHSMVVVSSSQQQQQRVQNVVVTSQGGSEHLGSPTGMQPRYSQQMARPSAPPPQERRELKQAPVGNSNYAPYQNQPQGISTQQQQHQAPAQQHNSYFQQQQHQPSKEAGAQQQHLGPPQHQRHHQQSELVQQLGAPLPNLSPHPIQQSISAQNSSFQIQQQPQQQRPPPPSRPMQHNNSNNDQQQQQHVALPTKLTGSNLQNQHQVPLNSPINHLHRQQESSISNIVQSPLNSNTSQQQQHGPIHLYNAPPPSNARSILLNPVQGSSTPHLAQTLSSNENSTVGSPAVVMHEHNVAYGPPQHQQYPAGIAAPHPGPTTTFVVQQSGGQRIYIQQPTAVVGGGAPHIIAQQPPPPTQPPAPQGYNGSHRFYTNAVNSMVTGVGTSGNSAGVLGVDNNPKEKYRELKRKFKFLVYENEYYQEELRNLQRKLLKLSRDKNFLLDRLGNHENNSSDNSSDDSEASVKTLEDRMPKQKRKSKQAPPRKKPTATPVATIPTANVSAISKRASSTLLEIKTEIPSSSNSTVVKTEDAMNLATSQPHNSVESVNYSNSSIRVNNGNFVPPVITNTANDTPDQFSHSNTTAF